MRSESKSQSDLNEHITSKSLAESEDSNEKSITSKTSFSKIQTGIQRFFKSQIDLKKFITSPKNTQKAPVFTHRQLRERLPLFISINDNRPEDFPHLIIISQYLKEEFNTHPTTISYCWLPIETLKDEGRFNQKYQKNVDILKRNFAAWRKVRGDGNCYYRSVISSYLLKIFHYSTEHKHSTNFFNKLLENKFHSAAPLSFEMLISTIWDLLKTFQNPSSHLQAYQETEKKLQDPEFDKCLIEGARFLSELSIYESSEISEFIDESSYETVKASLRMMGNEAEGVELLLLPIALGITVEQVNFFDEILKSSFSDGKSSELAVYIISKAKGHYDMLFEVRDMEAQCYSVNELIFYHN